MLTIFSLYPLFPWSLESPFSGAFRKIDELAKENPDKSITVVNSYPSNVCEDEEVELLEATLHKAVEEYTSSEGLGAQFPENVNCATVAYETDESNHPTLQGTIDILMQLTEQLKTTTKPLVWNTDFIATEQIYSSVRSIYRYGCGSCRRYGLHISREKHHCPTLCDDCVDAILTLPATQYSFAEAAKEYVKEKKAAMDMESEEYDDPNENEKSTNNDNDNDDDPDNRRKVPRLEQTSA